MMRRVLHILGQLSDQDVEWLIEVGQRITFSAGENVILVGKAIGSLFIVLDGELTVVSRSGQELNRAVPGDMLGELSFVDGAPPSASVIAATRVMLMSVDRQRIVDRLDGDAGFAARFYRAIAMFLAYRMRASQARFGFDGDEPEDHFKADELDDEVLGNVHLAGSRFERILKRLAR